jgi:ankyrin repeat protein
MGETQSKSASPSGWSASYDVEGPSSSRLIEACQRGQTDLVSKLLRRGKKISKVDERGDTALHKAAAYGFTEIVTLLLKKNSELANVENVEGLTPFHLAAQYGKIECARIILDAAPKLVNAPFTKNPSNFDYSFIGTNPRLRLLVSPSL